MTVMDGRDKKDLNDLVGNVSPVKLVNRAQVAVGLKPRFVIDKPRYDQSTFEGRFRHFFKIVNPINLLKTDAELDKAKEIVDKFRAGDDLPGMTDDEIWDQKAIVDSAFHPDTGEKQIIFGRMSAQVPFNMVVTAAMMTFYRSNLAQILLQWTNQSFNAITNYTNRSGTASISNTQLGTAYVCATGAGLTASIGLNRLFRNAPRLIGKFVPFVAVSMANASNIPIMRIGELTNGTSIVTENGKEVGLSKKAARKGVAQVLISRVTMAVPTMIILPSILEFLRKRGVFKKNSKLINPLQLGLIGIILVFSTPFGCALYPQIHPIKPSALEPELQEKIKKLPGPPTVVYYNKGL